MWTAESAAVTPSDETFASVTLNAYKEAVRKAKEKGRSHVTAGEVARALFNDERVTQAERTRVGNALSRLARDGRAARTRTRWDEAYKWALPPSEERDDA